MQKPVQISRHIFLAVGAHPRVRFDYVLHITTDVKLDKYYKAMHQQVLENHRVLLYGRRAVFVVIYYYLHRAYAIHPELRDTSRRILPQVISFVGKNLPHIQYNQNDLRELRSLETTLKTENHVHFSI